MPVPIDSCVDLHEVKRSLCGVEHTGPRRKLIDGVLSMGPAAEAFPRWNRRNSYANRVCIRRTQLHFSAAARHFQ
jgi:hypothetical protein